MQLLHEESVVEVKADGTRLFGFLDDHRNLSAHMERSSWMMAGSKMDIDVDAAGGRAVGSHIRLNGRVLGVSISVDEAVIERIPPHRKVWKTLGTPKLVVIGPYQMGFEVTGLGEISSLRVFIDYEAPAARWFRRLRLKLAVLYARWCTRRMASDAAHHFSSGEDSPMSTTFTPATATSSRTGGTELSTRVDSTALGIAAALATGLAFALCSLIVMAAPGAFSRFVSYALHLDVTGLVRQISWPSFLVGLAFTTIYAGLIVAATGNIYNRIAPRRS
jgi:hypothetical protein